MSAVHLSTVACAVCFAVSSAQAQKSHNSDTLSRPEKSPTAGRIAQIVNPTADIGERVKAVRLLGDHLSTEEFKSLCAFVKTRPGVEEKNLCGLQVVKNVVLDILQEQVEPSPGLTEAMVDVSRDPSQDPVVRDYAIQHLISEYDKQDPTSTSDKALIRSTLYEAARSSNSFAGTALLGIHRLATSDTDFAPGEIDVLTVSLLKGSADKAAAITAVQICAERQIIGALPQIRLLSQTTDNLALQVAAVAAIGKLGQRQDIPLLQNFATYENQTLRTVAEVALKRLQKQLQVY